MKFNLIAGAILNYSYNAILTHVPFHFVRKGFLRLFNKRIHRSSVILMHSRLLNFWKIEIGERVVINQYCLLDCRKYKISIQHDTDIGPYTRIWTLGHKPDSETHDLYGGPVSIGHHVWIASGVTVLPGVRIADGTVLASGSVLHKSTSSNDIIAGNPGRVIKKRQNALTYRLDYKPVLE